MRAVAINPVSRQTRVSAAYTDRPAFNRCTTPIPTPTATPIAPQAHAEKCAKRELVRRWRPITTAVMAATANARATRHWAVPSHATTAIRAIPWSKATITPALNGVRAPVFGSDLDWCGAFSTRMVSDAGGASIISFSSCWLHVAGGGPHRTGAKVPRGSIRDGTRWDNADKSSCWGYFHPCAVARPSGTCG